MSRSVRVWLSAASAALIALTAVGTASAAVPAASGGRPAAVTTRVVQPTDRIASVGLERRSRAKAVPPRPLVPIDIGTVPAVAGFPVTFDGVTRSTDEKGVAHFSAKNSTSLASRVVLHDATMNINGRPVKVSGQRLYGVTNPRITLDLSYQVSFSFANINGGHIDADEIKTVTVKSVTGLVAKIPAHSASWLQGSRVVPLPGGLQVKDLYWTIQDVEYAGSNVVNASQQRFEPAHQQSVKVSLLFYGVKLHVHDALFGYSEGRAVDLVYPNGSTSHIPLDKHGRVELPALPRGNYTLTAVGPGPEMSRPIAISRNQVVDLKFYSWVDLALVAAVLLLFTVGGLWWGHARRKRVGTAAPSTAEPLELPSQGVEPVSQDENATGKVR